LDIILRQFIMDLRLIYFNHLNSCMKQMLDDRRVHNDRKYPLKKEKN